jgi:hypothetical protein
MRTFARAALTLALTLPFGCLMAGCGGEGQNAVNKDAIQTMPAGEKQKYEEQMKMRMGGPGGGTSGGPPMGTQGMPPGPPGAPK